MRTNHLPHYAVISIDLGHAGKEEVAYVDMGQGDPVVLLHGSLADHRYWSPQLKELSLMRRVLAPSLAGYWPQRVSAEVTPNFSIQRHAFVVAAFIEAVAAQQVHLVGHSRGANVALATTLLRPSIVRSLVLADPGGVLIESEQEVRTYQPDATRGDAADLIRQGDIDAGLQKFIDSVSGPGVWNRLNTRRKQMAKDNASTLIAQVREAPPHLIRHELLTVEQATLLIGGEYSPPAYGKTLQGLSGCITHSSMQIIAKASHAMNAENPAAFNAVLSEFFSRVEKFEPESS